MNRVLDGVAVDFLSFKACRVAVGQYGNGRVALSLIAASPDDPDQKIDTATVNVVDAHPAPGCVFIKDYSENEGMMAALEASGVVKSTGRHVPTGYVEALEARLLVSIEEAAE